MPKSFKIHQPPLNIKEMILSNWVKSQDVKTIFYKKDHDSQFNNVRLAGFVDLISIIDIAFELFIDSKIIEVEKDLNN